MDIRKLGDIRFAVEWDVDGEGVRWDAFVWFTNYEEAREYVKEVWHNSRRYRIVSLEGAEK